MESSNPSGTMKISLVSSLAKSTKTHTAIHHLLCTSSIIAKHRKSW